MLYILTWHSRIINCSVRDALSWFLGTLISKTQPWLGGHLQEGTAKLSTVFHISSLFYDLQDTRPCSSTKTIAYCLS